MFTSIALNVEKVTLRECGSKPLITLNFHCNRTIHLHARISKHRCSIAWNQEIGCIFLPWLMISIFPIGARETRWDIRDSVKLKYPPFLQTFLLVTLVKQALLRMSAETWFVQSRALLRHTSLLSRRTGLVSLMWLSKLNNKLHLLHA